MIETNIRAMIRYEVENADYHYIYIVREGEAVFYVGRSLDPCGRMLQHIFGGRDGRGPSHLGHFIRRFIHDAPNWKVELLNLDDCKPYVDRYKTFDGDDEEWKLGYVYNGKRDKYWQDEVIASAEAALIRHYHPCLNIAGNPLHSPLPEKYRDLDDFEFEESR